jgi:predicted PurR-regulated permease PerM
MPSARTERAALIVLVVLSIALLAMVIYPFASALFVAAVLAAALTPWTDSVAARLRGRRQVAAGVLTLGALLLLVVPIAAVGLSLGKEVVAGIGYVKETLRSEGMTGLICSSCSSTGGRSWSGSRRWPRSSVATCGS